LKKQKNKSIPKNYKWSKEACKKEALKYMYRIDFKKNSKGAYPASRINGWLDEICSHMIPKGNKFKRLIYRFIFSDNYCYVGLTYDPERRRKDHLTKFNSSVYLHIIQTGLNPIFEKLTEYLDIENAKIQEEYWKLKSEEQGYFILNKYKTGALGSIETKWTKENCKKEALKYEYRTEFRKYSERAYMTAFHNGWLDEICLHLKYKYESWTKDKCKEEALKYNSRTDYFFGSSGSWDNARRNGWLDEICSHMIELKKPNNYWTLDKCKEEAMKYKTKSELRKNCPRAHCVLYENKLLNEIFQKNNNKNGKLFK
jgi:hypothetical protein